MNPNAPAWHCLELERSFHAFTDGGWPQQLYVREARRMASNDVMTQHNCQSRAVTEHPVGLADALQRACQALRVEIAGCLARLESRAKRPWFIPKRRQTSFRE